MSNSALAKFTISTGFEDHERAQVAQMYWEAFGPKLGKLMGPETKALAFLAANLDPNFAINARDDCGALLGLAGYKTNQGSLVGGGMMSFIRVYGVLSSLWRLPFLALLERPLETGVLQMDGIFVTAQSRGLGIGGALLVAIQDHARSQSLKRVRLDVIDTNPRAKALYQRQGFTAQKTENIGPLRHLLGFNSATRMEFEVSTEPQ